MLFKTLAKYFAIFALLCMTMTACHAASPRDVSCLIAATWNEARGRPDREIIAVMHAVINRSRHPAYPDTVCKVVLQRGQFQMSTHFRQIVHGLRKEFVPPSKAPADVRAFEKIRALAGFVLDGNSVDPTNGATHFYSPRLRVIMGLKADPSWAARILRTASIGEFRFHRLSKERRT